MTGRLGESRASLLAPILAAAAVFVFGVFYHWPLKLDHDVSYFLMTGHLVNQGARLYVDVLEFNTPASVELSQLSDWIAMALHAPLDLTHKAVLLAVMAGCLALSLVVAASVLRRPGAGAWCIAVGLAIVVVFGAAQGIGAREHLCSIMILPWAISLAIGDGAGARTSKSIALQMVIGAVAGFGMFFKPHFVVFGAGLGLVDLVRARGRPQRLLLSTWVAAAVSIALYVYLMLQPGYLSEMFPFYMQIMGTLRGEETFAVRDLVAVVAVIALGYLGVRPGQGEAWAWLPVSVGVVFCSLALVIFMQQGFGFGYQLMPMKAGIAVAAVFVLAWRLSGASSLARLSAIGLTVLSGLWIAFSVADPIPNPYPTREAVLKQPLLAALKPPHAGDSILAISTGIDPINEYLTMMDVKWAGPNLAYFPIAALIYQNGRYGIADPPAPEVRERMADWYLKKVAASLRATPPVRVAVETSERPMFFDNSNFDILAWMRENKDFDAAWSAAGLVKTGEPIAWNDRTYQMYAPAGSP